MNCPRILGDASSVPEQNMVVGVMDMLGCELVLWLLLMGWFFYGLVVAS